MSPGLGEPPRQDAERGGAARRPAPLRAASFNIRNGLALDGADSWPFRAKACAQAIAGLDADLVCLQEVYGFQLRRLLRRLPGYAAAGAPRDDGRRRGERCCVLYRPRRLRLRRAETRWYSDTPDVPGSCGWGAAMPRIATICRFRDWGAGSEFGAVSTHWDGASAESRRRSAAALLSWLDPALPWIVAGDLNATAGTPAVTRLLAGGLRDTLAELGERGPQAATHHAWDGSTSGTRIDFVLVTDEWRVEAAAIRHDRPGGRLPSDHWPVVADLRLD